MSELVATATAMATTASLHRHALKNRTPLATVVGVAVAANSDTAQGLVQIK